MQHLYIRHRTLHKQQTLGKILSSCLSAKSLTDKRDKLTDTGKLGKNALMFPRVIQHRKVCVSQEMASKKELSLHWQSWDQAAQTVSRKRNRKKCKGPWVKHCHHQSLNHLWTTGFSGRLGASWGKAQAWFRKNRSLSCCPGQSTVVWESGVLPVRRAVSSSSTDWLSDLESLKLCTCLVFLGETTQNKINIMELKTLRLFRTHCPQFGRKRYQGK